MQTAKLMIIKRKISKQLRMDNRRMRSKLKRLTRQQQMSKKLLKRLKSKKKLKILRSSKLSRKCALKNNLSSSR